jgi:hypothetical protein
MLKEALEEELEKNTNTNDLVIEIDNVEEILTITIYANDVIMTEDSDDNNTIAFDSVVVVPDWVPVENITFVETTSTTATTTTTTEKNKGKIKLKGKFRLDGLKAEIVVSQTDEDRQKSQATWKVKVKSFDSSLCPSEQFNWHIHQLPLDLGEGAAIRDSDTGNAAACGKYVTGGHYDPTFACGGASHNRVVNVGETGFYFADVCDVIDTATGVARTYSCTTDEPYLCEFGDQSGKLGKIDASNRETVKYKDRYMDNLADIAGRSLVLHCCTDSGCGDRLACAQLEEVDKDEWDDDMDDEWDDEYNEGWIRRLL